MINNSNSFENQFGIITGAASGIGRAAAIQLARKGAGVSLVDLDKDGLMKTESAIKQESNVQSLVCISDVTDEPEVQRVVAETAERFGAIDFLVNSAGILRGTSFLEISSDEWNLMMNVNLRGQFLLCQAVCRLMVGRGSGVIVNVASLAGRSSSLLGGAHYSSAKHALIGLSRHMAKELGPKGIRVNAFCPGATMTPMVQAIRTREELDALASSIPRRKFATPEEQASVIEFLISDASININGACIDSNGGHLMV